MITYYKNKKEFAKALISLIDSYWNYEILESEFLPKIYELSKKNEEKLYSNGEYSSIIKQRLGQSRIEILNKILINME